MALRTQHACVRTKIQYACLRLGSTAAAACAPIRKLNSVHHLNLYSDKQQHLEAMSGIGPELPPHLLAKRKRQQEEEAENETVTASGAKRSLSPSDGEKRRRVIGPAMPPAPLEKRPKAPPNQSGESDSDDDDGFGPTLPPNGTAEVKVKLWHFDMNLRFANKLRLRHETAKVNRTLHELDLYW